MFVECIYSRSWEVPLLRLVNVGNSALVYQDGLDHAAITKLYEDTEIWLLFLTHTSYSV